MTVDEYLNSGYSPDMEYVNGVLVERNVGPPLHSFLQKLVLLHFARFEQDLRFISSGVPHQSRLFTLPRA